MLRITSSPFFMPRPSMALYACRCCRCCWGTWHYMAYRAYRAIWRYMAIRGGGACTAPYHRTPTPLSYTALLHRSPTPLSYTALPLKRLLGYMRYSPFYRAYRRVGAVGGTERHARQGTARQATAIIGQ